MPAPAPSPTTRTAREIARYRDLTRELRRRWRPDPECHLACCAYGPAGGQILEVLPILTAPYPTVIPVSVRYQESGS